jgi:hypothetical protein
MATKMKMQKGGATAYKADPKKKGSATVSTTKAFNPKNNTLTTVNKSSYDPRKTKDVKVEKFTPGKSSYKEVVTGAGAFRKPTETTFNSKNNTRTTVNYKNVDGKQVKQIKVTKYAPASSSPKAAKENKVFKGGYKPIDKTPVKTPTPAPVKSAPAAKSVSQLWKEKTGKDWSEAKSLGLSDGSASSNMALLKKLKSGSLTNSDLSSSKFKDVGTLETKKLDTPKAELETKRKGGSVTKMQAGGVVDKIRSGMRNISRKINAPIKKTFKASAQKYQTGGMVNSNAKVTASKVASGRPVKSAEPKSAAKKATGRVGGISKAPRAAAPKMKMGGSMKRK